MVREINHTGFVHISNNSFSPFLQCFAGIWAVTIDSERSSVHIEIELAMQLFAQAVLQLEVSNVGYSPPRFEMNRECARTFCREKLLKF